MPLTDVMGSHTPSDFKILPLPLQILFGPPLEYLLLRLQGPMGNKNLSFSEAQAVVKSSTSLHRTRFSRGVKRSYFFFS